MIALSLLLVVGLAPQSPLGVETLGLEDGPELLVHRQAGPLVALRLSAPVPVDVPEGAIELLQELARPGVEEIARRFGARVELRHEGGRAIVAVAGPATAFDALAAVLRRATAPPDLSVASLRRGRARAEDRVLAALEQPGPRIRRLLRHGLYGGPAPVGAAAALVDREAIRGLRDRIYDGAALRVVLVGTVPDPVVRSAFMGWAPASRGEAAVVIPDTSPAPARPQAHREWAGIAFGVDADPAVLAVVAELVQRRVDRSALRYGAAEAWYEPGPALALIGAAVPGDSVVRSSARISELPVRDSAAAPAAAVSRYLRRLVAEAAALAGPDAVVEARTAIRRRLLIEARTAAGRAELIGRVADHLDPTGDPDRFLARLEAVDLEAVLALLDRVLATPAVVAESG